MKYLFVLLALINAAFAQKISKSDKKSLESIKASVDFLASDELEGRRAGTEGEKRAAAYITEQFRNIGIAPAFNNSSYLQPFEISETKTILPETKLLIDEKPLTLFSDYFPLAFSGEKEISAAASMSLREENAPWFYDLSDALLQNQHNPHFDIEQNILDEAALAKKKGATTLFIYNSSSIADSVQFRGTDKKAAVDIPVIYVTAGGRKKYLADSIEMRSYFINIKLGKTIRTGNNVAAFLNNGSGTTVVIGAHYDHLGYGEDKNSLYTGTEKMIHNGADDNASGCAAMLELAARIKKSSLKKNNYLFVAFSGEELGLFGSKYFTEHAPVDIGTVNYMINMDMLGRLNDSSKTITIGGYGTSPAWNELLAHPAKGLGLRFDSSGTGPSDHTSFYRKNIPVLFFFTGLHSDYHKPSDDADKINYLGETELVKWIFSIVSKADGKDRLPFLKTREVAMSSKSSFKVSMGIMPDYTFSGTGVRADGISEGRSAQKAGLLAGDIILQINDYNCPDLEKYMEALSHFSKGDSARVKVQRGTAVLFFDIVF